MAEMNRMSAEHEKGDIDARIDAGRYDGAFRELASGIDDMAASHAATRKAMDVVKAFGQGDFDSPLETFTGKNAFITATIEQVRTSLKALVDDARMLADAAVEGRLETRADATKHQGDFRAIVDGVHNTLDAVIGPLNEVGRLLKAMEDGDR